MLQNSGATHLRQLDAVSPLMLLYCRIAVPT